MTISKAEFIKYLQELPEEVVEIEVLCEKRGYYESYTTFKTLTEDHLEVLGNTLYIGENIGEENMPFTTFTQRDIYLSSKLNIKKRNFSTPASFFILYNWIRNEKYYHDFKMDSSKYHSIYAFDDDMIHPDKFAWAVYYYFKSNER